MSFPAALLPLLACRLCNNTLTNPTTLACGHSVCSSHAAQPSCCTDRPTAALPRIPPESRVRYTPADPVPPAPAHHEQQRTDVTLTNLISLVTRTAQRLRPLPADNDDDDDDHPVTSARSSRSASPRPRKRHKASHNDDDDDELDLLAHLRAAATRHRQVAPDVPLIPPHGDIITQFDKKLLDELTCHICYVLFYQPVTTPCQHTYCAKCLQRSLDHSTTCPVCRQEIPPYYFQDQPVNKTLMSIILRAFPLLYQERGAAIEEDERHARLNTPIFVCQLSFPGVPTILHFFEPRYRLMLRRCLETPNPRFGMIMSPKPGVLQNEYGTMLEIRSVQMLPDGRSMVETWGSSRFRILEKGTLDGYMVGRIERIDDYPDDLTETLILDEHEIPPPRIQSQTRPLLRRIATSLARPSHPEDTVNAEPIPTTPQRTPTNDELMDTCRAFLDRLQAGAAPWVVQRLSSTYGNMPTDPALFSFWVALVLPLEEHEKAKLLPIRSARLRLMLVVHWIDQLNNNWYAWLCFVVWHGWIVDGPAGPCAVWIALVLTFFRLIGWI